MSASAAASAASSPLSFSSRREVRGRLAGTHGSGGKKAPSGGAVGAESRRRPRRARAPERARASRRACARATAVDFESGRFVSAPARAVGRGRGPARRARALPRARARVRGSDLYVSAASAAFSGPETGETVGDEDRDPRRDVGGVGGRVSRGGHPPRRTRSAPFGARSSGEDLRYLRSERLDVAADAGFAAIPTSPERARVAAAMASPRRKRKRARPRSTTPFSASLLSNKHATVRAARRPAAAAAAASAVGPRGGASYPPPRSPS